MGACEATAYVYILVLHTMFGSTNHHTTAMIPGYTECGCEYAAARYDAQAGLTLHHSSPRDRVRVWSSCVPGPDYKPDGQ